MSVILNCAHKDEVQPYIGVDPACNKSAIFCIEHDPHKNKQGLLHQMMPLSHFRRTINEMKFKMGDKVAVLTQQYSSFMDELIKQINQLKLRKIVELSMLWLRQLASNQQQYENLRKLYRNDYEGLTCKDIHWLYFKVISNQTLEKQKIQDIQCYKDICKVMNTLQQSVKARLMITQKISELQGVVQKGQLLRRALPDRKILKENTKEILLQVLNKNLFELKYNIIAIKQNSRNFQSIFSKYPLIDHTNYHLLVKTKYSNILLGICNDQLKKSVNQTFDLHYSQHSIVYNCSNGCIYRDGMFQSGSAHLTKGQKELQLIFRLTDTEMLILMGKNVICRAGIQKFKKNKVYLHMLMRTLGDSIQIDRDRFVAISEEKSPIDSNKNNLSDILEQDVSGNVQIQSPLPKIPDRINVTSMQLKTANNNKQVNSNIKTSPLVQSLFQNKKDNMNIKQIINLANSIPLSNSLGEQLQKKQSKHHPKSSNVFIQMESSLGEQAEQASSKYTSNIYDQALVEDKKQTLINPAVLPHIKKSQFQISLKSSSNYNLSPIPSAQFLKKITSGETQKNSDWL